MVGKCKYNLKRIILIHIVCGLLLLHGSYQIVKKLKAIPVVKNPGGYMWQNSWEDLFS